MMVFMMCVRFGLGLKHEQESRLNHFTGCPLGLNVFM